MQKPNLTKKQRALATDLKDLMARLRLDPDQIVDKAEPDARTTYLKLARDQIIRSAIILKYVLMDEHLSAVMCWHYFGKKRSFPQLWKTERFRTFNYFILEKLYLLQKLELVKNVHDIPGWVLSDLAALNDLRNGIAHSFFPENRRRKPDWKGKSVFTRSGFDHFLEDMDKLSEFFLDRFWS